jgi:uncharacterized membrane protein YfcA
VPERASFNTEGDVMWKQYKKTFSGMQVVIVLVTLGILLWRHAWDLAGVFFITMQVGAVLGAMWGARLKNKLDRTTGEVALR